MSDYDPISKRLIQDYAGDIIELVTGHRLKYSIEHLDKESISLKRDSDAVLKVYRDGQEYILHIEIQTRKDPVIAVRMLEYCVFLHSRFSLPVYPVLINLTGRSRQSSYSWHLEDMAVLHFQYRCVDLTRYKAEEHMYRVPVGLVPFVPLMSHQIPSEELLIECSRRIEGEAANPVEKANLYLALGTLARLKLAKSLILKIIEVSKVEDSLYYDLIKEKWEALGMEKGTLRGSARRELVPSGSNSQ